MKTPRRDLDKSLAGKDKVRRVGKALEMKLLFLHAPIEMKDCGAFVLALSMILSKKLIFTKFGKNMLWPK